MSRGNLFHTLQSLDAALRLLGLARLCFKARDIGLHVRNFFLLALVIRLLLRQLLRALELKTRIVTAV